MSKVSSVLLSVFAIGILICLFAGGLSLLGYAAAMIIGGDTAAAVCSFVLKSYLPVVIKTTSAVTGVGLIGMYLTKQKELTVNNENVAKK
ncbi:MAG: hypothetical protein MJ192_02700 [Clostridia bacterium]|nr:hypothetical protein [Clostridia bacterium]